MFLFLKLTYCNVKFKHFPASRSEEEEDWEYPNMTREWGNKMMKAGIGKGKMMD